MLSNDFSCRACRNTIYYEESSTGCQTPSTKLDSGTTNIKTKCEIIILNIDSVPALSARPLGLNCKRKMNKI